LSLFKNFDFLKLFKNNFVYFFEKIILANELLDFAGKPIAYQVP
jgi:hypothetical protein